MHEAAAVRWRKYGKDRLYVNATDGTRLGWRDLLTGADNIEPGALAGVYHAAVTAWLDEHPSLRPTGNPPSSTSTPHDELHGALDGLDATPSVLDAVAPSAPPAGAAVGAIEDGTDIAATTEEAQLSSSAGSATTDVEHDLAELVASLVAAHESDVAPDHHAVEAVASDDGWEDLAERLPGAAARAEAVRLRRDKPIRTVVARVLRVHTDERAWRIGAEGEEKVAVRLTKLANRDPRWPFLHAVPVGERSSDIDHLVIGPPGCQPSTPSTTPVPRSGSAATPSWSTAAASPTSATAASRPGAQPGCRLPPPACPSSPSASSSPSVPATSASRRCPQM